jgi:NAD(P)-dependent dehydrogenase (short-subunit alcohol dehydrogenase family)
MPSSPQNINKTNESIQEVLKTKTTTFHGVGRKKVGLNYLPKPDFLSFSLPTTHIALITNDGGALTVETLSLLESRGNRVVVLNLPQTKASTQLKNVVNVENNSDEAIAKALAQITEQYGQVGTFIHLHPQFTFQNGNFAQHFQTEKSIIKSVFLLAKHLQKPLNELGAKQRANFLTVSQMDGQFGLGKRGNVSVLAGGLRGLVKSLNLEWSPVFCRVVDIEPELKATTKSQHILAELHDADVSILETAISKAGRQNLIATSVEVKENQEIKTTITKDSVFLVSGGAKGVTATCVKEIAKTFQCKFILLGRSSNDFEVPAFAINESNEGALKRLIMNDLKEKGEAPSLPKVKSIYNKIISKKEVQGTLDAIASYGAKAVYLKGDVTNAASFKANLATITATLGPITGVIHGAGRLADKFIQDKTETDFDNVLSVKLDGLLSLLQSVNIHNLDHLMLFSSVAGFYGNVGQTDYAIANEILSSAAHLFKTNHPNTHVSAINWGAWDGGMVSAALKKQFEAAGVSLVNSDGGAAMCVNEFSSAYFEEPQVVIGGTLPAGISHISEDLRTHKIQRRFTLNENQFLYHHVIQGSAVLPVVNAGAWMAQSCEKLFPDFQVFKVENMQLFKGIVFEDKRKIVKDCTLELKELEKTAERIIFEATVSSQGARKKLPTFHYKAKVTIVNKKSIPTAPNFKAQIDPNFTALKGDYLYKDGSLFHGLYFQGIEEILDWNEQQIVLSCKAPKVPVAAQGQFPVSSVNTFFSDIQYQGMVIWVQKYHDGAKSLPLATVSATIYEPVPFDKMLFVQVEIIENNEFKLVANCTTYDADGKVYMVTEGAAVTVSKELKW